MADFVGAAKVGDGVGDAVVVVQSQEPAHSLVDVRVASRLLLSGVARESPGLCSTLGS